MAAKRTGVNARRLALRIVDDAQHIDTPAADDQRIAIAR